MTQLETKKSFNLISHFSDLSTSSGTGKPSIDNRSVQLETRRQNLLYHAQGKLSIGQVNRFWVKFNRSAISSTRFESDEQGEYIWLRVKNEELNILRPIYITGPFTFYVDVTPINYDLTKDFSEDIQYNTDIKPGQSFKAKLRFNDNSKFDKSDNEGDWYSWKVDIASQLTLTTNFTINYDFRIGFDKQILKKSLESINDDNNDNDNDDAEKGNNTYPHRNSIDVTKFTNKDVWTRAPKSIDKPVHLVILTHGIFSNVGADMLYLKDQIELEIENNPNANIIVRGYDGNVGKPEKGIKYLGRRLGDFVLDLYDKSPYKVDRISFIAHSLGGTVQSYAVYHIVTTRPSFFQDVIPINFIALASPFLGILQELPKPFALALDVGVLGTTGRDLTLSHKFPSLVKKDKSGGQLSESAKQHSKLTAKPVLEQILRSKAHVVFENFLNRTLYANAINDGIVPLKTSALLYLDWKSLGEVQYIKRKEGSKKGDGAKIEEPQSTSRARKGTVGEIPDDLKVDETDTTPEESSEITQVDHAKNNKENETPQSSSDSLQRDPSQSAKGIESSKSSKSSFSLKSGSTFIGLEKRRNHRIKKYLRTQTGSKKNKEETTSNDADQDDDTLNINIPPTASTILSAANVMKSPQPDAEYLTNPHSRAPTIFHDKIYSFDDLPDPIYGKHDGNPFDTNLINSKKVKAFISGHNKKALEEAIARSWHWNMQWRKVLVTLKPDAHNNIIVRRRYVNAWGWGVIDHLANNHFSEEAIRKENEYVESIKKTKADPSIPISTD